MNNLVQYQTDLDQCCGPVAKPKRYLTGIEKQALELIEDEYKREFGRQL